MKAGLQSIFARVAVCVLAVTATVPAGGQRRPLPQSGIIVTNNPSKQAAIGIGIAALGVGIGLGVYFIVRGRHNLTGCAVSGASGLQLQVQNDQRTFALVGEVTEIKPGERVRVSGKKEKKSAGALQQFLVEKLSKDFGACTVQPAVT
jgi:hypothetical protein